jgi:putative addiction module CopG family antidote
MDLSMAPELAAFMARQIRSGRYRTASDVVQAALRIVENAAAHPGDVRSPSLAGQLPANAAPP